MKKLFLLAYLFMPGLLAAQMVYPGGYIYLYDPGDVSAYSGAPTMGNATIDATNEKAAIIYKVGPSITIGSVTVPIGNTVTAGTFDLRIETVNNATGMPSDTLYCGSTSSGTFVLLSTDDNVLITENINSPCTIAADDYFAVVFVRTSAGNTNIQRWSESGGEFNYTASSNTGPGYVKNGSLQGTIAFTLSDGTIYNPPDNYPYYSDATGAINAFTFSNSTAPNYAGVRFKLPMRVSLVGWMFWGDLDGNADILVYDSSMVVIATTSLNSSIRVDTSPGKHTGLFKASVNLEANTYYRMIIRPTTNTTITLYDAWVATGAINNSLFLGTNWHRTTATNPTTEASWSQQTTYRPTMGLIIDGFDTNVNTGSMGIGY